MDKYYFGWKANLDDGTVISQYVGKKETLYSEVEDNMDKIESFQIIAEDGEQYTADLVKGELDLNGKKSKSLKSLPNNAKADLIYKRRNQARVDITTGEQLSARTMFIIGIKHGEEEISAEVFPGLGMAKKSIKIKEDREEKDITAEMEE